MHTAELYWLPEPTAFSELLASAQASAASSAERLALLQAASRLRLDFIQTMKLERCIARLVDASAAGSSPTCISAPTVNGGRRSYFNITTRSGEA